MASGALRCVLIGAMLCSSCRVMHIGWKEEGQAPKNRSRHQKCADPQLDIMAHSISLLYEAWSLCILLSIPARSYQQGLVGSS